MTFVLTGLDIEAKAELTLRSLERGARAAPNQFAEFDARLIRSDKPDAPTQRRGHRPAADHRKGRRSGAGGPVASRGGHRAGAGRLPRAPPHRAARRRPPTTASTGLRWCPPTWSCPRSSTPMVGGWRYPTGHLTAGSGRPAVVGCDRRVARPRSHRGTGLRARARTRTRFGCGSRHPADADERVRRARSVRTTRRLPLGTLIGARSGDKGGNANVGLWARTDEAWAWLDGYLTLEDSASCCPRPTSSRSSATPSPTCGHSTSWWSACWAKGWPPRPGPDPQAKGLGEYLRSRVVDIPVDLLSGD